jgi:protease-4
LLAKIGVTLDTYKTAPRADAESMFRGFTPDERRELEHKVAQFYDTFLDRVNQGRGMPKAEIDAIGRGKVWLGQQALEKHLIDHLGGLREALEAARAAAHLPDDAPIDELPRENRSLVQWVLDSVGGSADEPTATAVAKLPPAIGNLARALAPLAIYRDDEPLARMEYVDIAGD